MKYRPFQRRHFQWGGLIASLLACWTEIAHCADPVSSPPPNEMVTLSPHQPINAERGEPVTYQIDFSVIVTAPDHTRKLKVWLPLPQSDSGQQISNVQLTTFPMKLEPRRSREPVYGNEFSYFEFDHPAGAQIIRLRCQAVMHELRWQLDPSKVRVINEWPESFADYLKPQSAIATDPLFLKSLRSIVPSRRGEANDLFAVMNWVDQNLKYDHINASLNADAKFAYEERRGHCSDFHGLCATMSRSLGYPTRVAYGINLFPKSSPSHCKLEAYLPPYGWVTFDVSETQKMIAAINADVNLKAAEKDDLARAARNRLRSGFRDNTWLGVTRGIDYDLAPKASRKVTVIRTIYAEADGVALPEPDPANPQKREFSWMTAHEYQSDRTVTYPFKDWSTLKAPSVTDETRMK